MLVAGQEPLRIVGSLDRSISLLRVRVGAAADIHNGLVEVLEPAGYLIDIGAGADQKLARGAAKHDKLGLGGGNLAGGGFVLGVRIELHRRHVQKSEGGHSVPVFVVVVVSELLQLEHLADGKLAPSLLVHHVLVDLGLVGQGPKL